MWIEVSVTPWSVAPLALPGPHGDRRVPNVLAAAAAEVLAPVVVEAAADVDGDEPRVLLHAEASRASAATAVSPRNDHVRRSTSLPPVWWRRPPGLPRT